MPDYKNAAGAWVPVPSWASVRHLVSRGRVDAETEVRDGPAETPMPAHAHRELLDCFNVEKTDEEPENSIVEAVERPPEAENPTSLPAETSDASPKPSGDGVKMSEDNAPPLHRDKLPLAKGDARAELRPYPPSGTITDRAISPKGPSTEPEGALWRRYWWAVPLALLVLFAFGNLGGGNGGEASDIPSDTTARRSPEPTVNTPAPTRPDEPAGQAAENPANQRPTARPVGENESRRPQTTLQRPTSRPEGAIRSEPNPNPPEDVPSINVGPGGKKPNDPTLDTPAVDATSAPTSPDPAPPPPPMQPVATRPGSMRPAEASSTPVRRENIARNPRSSGNVEERTFSRPSIEEETASTQVPVDPAELAEPAIIAARRLGEPRADYPRRALERGWEGVVVLRFDVNIVGSPVDIRVARREGRSVFDEAAINAVSRLRYMPRRVNGRATPQRDEEITIEFVLSD